MKNMKRILVTLVAAVLLMTMTVAGTIAWLASKTEVVTNTFSVGDVTIVLYETDVDEDSDTSDKWAVDNAYDRNNAYKLLPAAEFKKDPTVFVEKNSEEAYIRMIVKVVNYDNMVKAFEGCEESYVANDVFLLEKLVDWNTKWEFETYNANNNTYEFRYFEPVSTVGSSEEWTKLDPLFKKITMPGDLTNGAIDLLNGVQIVVEAHAIQTQGFNGDVDLAWETFNANQPTTLDK